MFDNNATARTTATAAPTTHGDLATRTRGKQYSAMDTEPRIPDNVYAYDSNIYWLCRGDFEKQEGPGAMCGTLRQLRPRHARCACSGCSASPAAYADPSTYDGADLPDIDMGQGKSIQCVLRNAPSLGTIIRAATQAASQGSAERRTRLGYGSVAKMKTKVYGYKYVPWPTRPSVHI
jgi:hypothetical protein